MEERKSLSEKAKELMNQRDKIEAEISSIKNCLCSPDMPGIDGNLLDSEGFPRDDIDIPVIRGKRHRLACLLTDHKEITKEVEVIIHKLHSHGPQPGIKRDIERSKPETVVATTAPSAKDLVAQEFSGLQPFAVIDDIQEGSPASVGGLCEADEVVDFGGVRAGPGSLETLSLTLKKCEGRDMKVVVRRQGDICVLPIRPQVWQGVGVLGCRLKPV